MKKCVKCGELKDFSLFKKDKRMRDGRTSWCKACEYERYLVWIKTPSGVTSIRAATSRYQKSEKGRAHARATWRERKLAYKTRHPQKVKARVALSNAVLTGRVQPLPCFICGEKAEAHHPDYSSPLAVIWLCREHHNEVHRAVA